MTVSELRKKAMALPLTPGVYIMKNADGQIIYIGKAKALRNRVSQYFGSPANHTVKVRKMVENVHDFDYILVSTEFEALVLESNLIKLHKPKYNILLKDDKGNGYIRVSKDGWPTLSASKQKENDNADYYGPYASTGFVTKSVDEALAVFKLPTCGKHFPKDINRHGRPCLNYHINLCMAPCCGKVTESEYREAVEGALDMILNGSGEILRKLKAEMMQASDRLEFEKAARIRDRIEAIKKTAQKQTVVSLKVPNQDVFAVVTGLNRSCLSVLRFADGRLYDSETFITEAVEENAEDRSRLIMNYYSIRRPIPERVAVDIEPADRELLEQWLKEKAGHKTEIFIPKQGEGAKLMRLATDNASEKLSKVTGRSEKQMRTVEELGEILGLPEAPVYIESYDISHTAGSETVGGMIVFAHGKPLKDAYRRFAVKQFTNDDCASMAEVLSRRFTEYKVAGQHETGFGRLPDLILLDGGQGEVNAVREVMRKHGISVPLFGMVKDGKHRTRAIATSGGEIAINENRAVFNLVTEIQDEVHRFAIAYHRKKHRDASLVMTLTKIEGVGEKRAKALLMHFGSIKAIREADISSLCSVSGLTEPVAYRVFQFFHNEEE